MFRKLFQKWSDPGTPSGRPSTTRLGMEQLEDRTVPSTIQLINGQLLTDHRQRP